MYVASAVYADRAGTADTASNALKLGGYDASDYLRKDEMKNTVSTYTETEWQTAGTYYFIVPEGVNKLYVTTVGGGGGVGFNYFTANNGTNAYIFSGGQGGEVHFDYVDVTPGETITVVVGSKGKNVAIPTHPVYIQDFQRNKGKNGGCGGDSYLARSNGQKITNTMALGGNGGSGVLKYGYYSFNSNSQPGYESYGGGVYNNDTRSGGGVGASLFNDLSTGALASYNGSQKGYSGKMAWSNCIYVSSTSNYGPRGYYTYGAGGGSWGDGCDPISGSDAGIGGGGCVKALHSGNGFRNAGDGLVNIKAIGTIYKDIN